MTDKKINWDQFYLPNIPLYRCKLPQEIVDRLWDYVKKAETSLNKGLAGNISESLSLVDEDNFFMKNVIFPVCQKYGICGIKVWINKGEILNKDPYASEKNKLNRVALDNEYVVSKKN